MSDLLNHCIAHIQSIIDQLRTDLQALPEGSDTAAILEAIQRMEDTLHKLQS